MLKSWAQGETSAVGVWRICHAIVAEDGSDCGLGMKRLSDLSSVRSGSERNCNKKLLDLLAGTALAKMVEAIPHERGDKTVTQPEPPQVRPELRGKQSGPQIVLGVAICQRGWP